MDLFSFLLGLLIGLAIMTIATIFILELIRRKIKLENKNKTGIFKYDDSNFKMELETICSVGRKLK